MMQSPSDTACSSDTALPSMQKPALPYALENAITRQDEKTVRHLLATSNLSPGMLWSLLVHALRKKSSLAIKDAVLQHPGCPPQHALELAIRHKDIFTARQALQRGADPEKITLGSAITGSMRALLTYARRKNKLYPPDAPAILETDLDRALRNGLDECIQAEARYLLFQASSGKNVQEAWQYAVKNKRLDIQRAVLLLHADRNPGFCLKQEGLVTNRAVAEVMREILDSHQDKDHRNNAALKDRPAHQKKTDYDKVSARRK